MTTFGSYLYTNPGASQSVDIISILSQVDTPTIEPVTGDITSITSVTITSLTAGAVIYYTLDGSIPTGASSLYTIPFSVNETTTVKAIAIKTGMTSSEIATVTYTKIILLQVDTPIIQPVSGNITSPISVTITSPTDGAEIRVTYDGTTPTVTSSLYTGSFIVDDTMTVKAIAIKTGMTPSEVATKIYTNASSVISFGLYLYSEASTSRSVDIGAGKSFGGYSYSNSSNIQDVDVNIIVAQVEAPIILPAGGLITGTIYATITSATAGAEIRVTYDGTTPTSTSLLYTTSFAVNRTLTVKAIAMKAGMTDSEITIATYTMEVNQVETPVVLPNGGNFNAPVTTSITTPTIGAEIFYTTNGTIPAPISENLYSTPFLVSSNSVIKTMATKSGWLNSSVMTANFVIIIETKVARPQITPNGGVFVDPITVTLGTSTVGTNLHYTLNGDVPDATSPIGTAPIPISDSLTLKVIGIKAGLEDSDVVEATYFIQSTASPTTFVASNNVEDSYGTSAVLEWTMDYAEGLTGFKVLYGISSGSYTDEAIINDSSARSFILSGLTTDTTYYFVIKALYGSLESLVSAEASCFVEDVVAPMAPTDFVASVTADGQGVWLRWVNPAVDFSHVVLVKNLDRVPTTPTDGENIYSGTGEEYTDKDI